MLSVLQKRKGMVVKRGRQLPDVPAERERERDRGKEREREMLQEALLF